MNVPADEKQFRFWVMRRKGTPNITIANLLGISRQAVSRALLTVEKKSGPLLRIWHMLTRLPLKQSM
jgi:transcriptional regulator